MTQYGYYDQQVFSNISATPAAFKLNGGSYGIEVVTASWGGGNVDLQRLAADGTTYVSVLSSVFTANGFQAPNIPPGTYKLVITTATAVYADITSVISALG